MKHKLMLLVVAVALLLCVQAYAGDVPFDVQTKLMLKIISMDRNFERFGTPVKIGCSSDECMKELNVLKASMKISGKDFLVEKIASPADVDKYKVVYIGKNMAGSLGAIASKAAANSCLVFSETEEGVTSGGASVSFKVVDASPKIIVNLDNAKKQGTDFPANFLKVTVVVGGLN